MYVTLRIDFFMRKCACCQQCVDGLLYLFFYEENIFVFFFHQVLFPGHPFQLFLTGLEALQPGRTLVAQLFVMLDFFPDTGNLPFQFNTPDHAVLIDKPDHHHEKHGDDDVLVQVRFELQIPIFQRFHGNGIVLQK